jgi:Concanavalin A-like lectin/glucanases superfamily
VRCALACLIVAGCGNLLGLEHVDPPPPPDAPLLIDAPTGYASVILADLPVAYLPLYDAGDVSTAVDLVRPGSPGNVIGNVTRGDPAARPEFLHSMTFDGTNGAIDLGDVFPFEGAAAYSIEAWINPGYSTQSFYTIVSKWHETNGTGPAAGWNLYYIKAGPIAAQIAFSRQPADTIAQANLPNTWHHIVGTFGAGMLTVYIDGTQQGTKPATNPLTDLHQHLLIGAGDTQTGEPMLGSIDQVAIYDHALSAARVMAHFNAAPL